MNSSEPLQPLTPHEEKLTAYLDGQLAPEDAALFEREHPEVVALKAEQRTLANALRKHSATPPLGNRDFFNHQILRQIQPPEPAPAARRPFPLWRLVLAGACSLLAAVAVIKTLPVTPHGGMSPGEPAPKYLAQVTKVQPGDYLLTAKLVNADGLAVVWVDGMDKLSPDYVLQ